MEGTRESDSARRLVAETVGVLATIERVHFSRGEKFGVPGIEQLVILERVGETQQVFDGRISAAGGSPTPGQRVRVRLPSIASAGFRVTHGTIGHDLVFRPRSRGRHAGGLVDVFEDVLVVTLAADFFDQYTEQQKSIVAVRPATAWFEFEAAVR